MMPEPSAPTSLLHTATLFQLREASYNTLWLAKSFLAKIPLNLTVKVESLLWLFPWAFFDFHTTGLGRLKVTNQAY
jgi:hypothetical protein